MGDWVRRHQCGCGRCAGFAMHLNRQHQMRWQLLHLSMEIADATQTFANDGKEFVMTVGQHVFSARAPARRQLGRWSAPAVTARRTPRAGTLGSMDFGIPQPRPARRART